MFDDTKDAFLDQRDSTWMSSVLLSNSRASGTPTYYNFNGVDATSGDTQVDLYPVPDGAYTLRFNLYIPQTALVNDSDIIKIPSDIVVLGAYARAVMERGEDAGMSSSDAYAMFRNAVADAVALDHNIFINKDIWYPV